MHDMYICMHVRVMHTYTAVKDENSGNSRGPDHMQCPKNFWHVIHGRQVCLHCEWRALDTACAWDQVADRLEHVTSQ